MEEKKSMKQLVEEQLLVLGKEKKRSLYKNEQILENRGKDRQFQHRYSVEASALQMVYVSEPHTVFTNMAS